MWRPALVTSGFLTPEGVGYLFLSDRARERIQPTLVGWVSVPNPHDYNNFDQGWNAGTLAWETGTGPTGLIHGLEQSLNLLTQIGIKNIRDHLEALTDHLSNRLQDSNYEVVSSRKPEEKSQTVCIRSQSGFTPMNLYSHLMKQKIVTAPRGDRLRISPHLYNTFAEIDHLVEALT